MEPDKGTQKSMVGVVFRISNETASGEKRHFSTVIVAVHILFFFFFFIRIVPCQGDKLLYYSQDCG